MAWAAEAVAAGADLERHPVLPSSMVLEPLGTGAATSLPETAVTGVASALLDVEGFGTLLVFASSTSLVDVELQSDGTTTQLPGGVGVLHAVDAPIAPPFVLTGSRDGVISPAAPTPASPMLFRGELAAP